MFMHFTAVAVAFYINALICIVLAFIVWKRKAKPGGITFTLLLISLAAWSFASALEDGSPDFATKITFSKLSYLGITTAPPLFLLFSIYYSRKNQYLKLINLVILYIIPFITLLLVFSNEWHHLIWSSIIPSPGTNGEILIYNHGPMFWVYAAFSYFCMLSATIILVRTARSYPPRYRSQTILFFIAAVIPWIGNLIYLSGLSPIKGLDTTPLSFVLAAVIIGWNVYRFQLFSVVPIAREMIVENMSDGIVVLDNKNMIMDINQAAAQIIDRERKALVGKPVEDVMKEYPELIKPFRGVENAQMEVEIKGSPDRVLDIRVTPLREQTGQLTGRLFIVHDISRRKKIEQEEHEQRLLAEALSDSATAMNSLRDFHEVLDRILVDISRVVPNDAANIAMVNEEGVISFVRSCGYQQRGLEETVKAMKISMENAPSFQRMAETGKPVMIPDTKADPEWFATASSEWIRSYLGAPIRSADELVGFLNLDSATPNFYNQKHAVWLQAFADQAAIAIENARLFEKVSRNAEEMEFLYRITSALSSGLDLSGVIKELYQQCRKIVSIDLFDLTLLDEKSGDLHFEAYNRKGDFVRMKPKNINIRPGMNAYIIHNRKNIYIPDMNNVQTQEYINLLKHFPKDRGRSYLGVPIMIGDRAIGVFSLHSDTPNAYSDEKIQLIETVAQASSISLENARLFERMKEFAITDGLTGLLNHRHFSDMAEKEIARATRYKKPLSFIMIDIDHFKLVNDRFGHLVGDQTLQLVAKNCQSTLRANDIISRYGGEEFTILLPETDAKDAMVVAERVREAINSSNIITSQSVVKITGSLGVATLSDCPPDLKSLIACADHALYAAKEAGRNRVVAYQAGIEPIPSGNL